MTDKELRVGYIGWSPDFREYKDIKVRKTVVGRVVTKQEWEAALTTAYREGVEAMRDAVLTNCDRWRMQRGKGPGEYEPVADPSSNWILLGDVLTIAARLLEATPNETTREAIDEAERGEAATYNDAQTLFAHLGLDEEDAP